MRLNSLYINGYGILNNFQLSFEDDLTVIYGLNGAGKSTLLSFFRACLYGFYPRGSGRRYEPLYGGTHGGIIGITHNNISYSIERTSHRRSSGLLKINNLSTGKTESEDMMEYLLSGISQSVFESVFAFGLQELQQLELLNDQELASHLYSVGLGSKISLATIDQQLTSAMEEIYKPRGRKPTLNTLLEKMTTIRHKLISRKELVNQHRQLSTNIAQIEKQVTVDRQLIAELTCKLQRAKLILEAWPHWQELVIKETELKKFSPLDLPFNGLERANTAYERLQEVINEYDKIISVIPQAQQELANIINIEVFQKEFLKYSELITAKSIACQVAQERLDKGKMEQDYLNSKIKVVDLDIAKVYVGLPDTDLSLRQQWLANLKGLSSQQQKERTRMPLVTWLATWGWLVVTVLFLVTNQKIVAMITAFGLIGSIIHLIIEKRGFNQKQKALSSKIRELSEKLCISDLATEIDLVDQALQEESKLVEERKLLLRDLHLKLANNENLRLELTARLEELAIIKKEWQMILTKNMLPREWEEDQINSFIQASQILPGLARRIEQYQKELTSIFQLCGSDDILEIQHLYEKQMTREKLQQEIMNLEAILSTYLNQPSDNTRNLFRGFTKEMLIEENRILESELQQLQTNLEENLNSLGSLTTQRKLLENNNEQEELRLELQIVTAQAQQLANQWASYRTCQWAINQVKSRYEKEKQPELLLYTTEYFRTITEANYTRVFVPLGTQEIKVENSKGQVLNVSQLSQGTVEQLYLSLRFALIACMANQGKRVPVLLDDILVNFDHIRLKQATDLIHEISKNQQIIILTCHKSLLDLFNDRQKRTIES